MHFTQRKGHSLDVCTGQNWKSTRPGLTGIRHDLQFYLHICYRYFAEARYPFILARMKLDLFTICSHFCIIIACSFNA